MPGWKVIIAKWLRGKRAHTSDRPIPTGGGCPRIGLNAPSPGLRQRRQKHSGQDGDTADDCQQFDECESPSPHGLKGNTSRYILSNITWRKLPSRGPATGRAHLSTVVDKASPMFGVPRLRGKWWHSLGSVPRSGGTELNARTVSGCTLTGLDTSQAGSNRRSRFHGLAAARKAARFICR